MPEEHAGSDSEDVERYMSDTRARAYRAYIDLRQTHLTDRIVFSTLQIGLENTSYNQKYRHQPFP